MKISIVIPTSNSSQTIRVTLDSIKRQTYQEVEVIVVDNLSQDSTLSIVKEYINFFDIKIISEKDQGLYDAMNKGIDMVSGEIVHILNSDDFYFDSTVLHMVEEIFSKNKQIDGVYGDLSYVNRDTLERKKRFWKAGIYRESQLYSGWIIPHPTLFLRKKVYEQVTQKFNLTFVISADYEFILRLLKVYRINIYYLTKTLVTMRVGGLSDHKISKISKIKAWRELRHSWKINNMRVPPFLVLKRIVIRIKQFFSK